MSTPPVAGAWLSRDWKPWRVVVCLWGAFFLAYVSRQSVFSIFPILRSQLSFTELELGLTGTVFLWAYALGNPVAGYLCDRFAKRKLLVASVVVWSLCTFLIGMSTSAPSLLALRGALALAQALYIPAAIALISQLHSESTRATAISLHGSGQYAGIIFGGWFGGWAAEAFGWRWMLWLVALAGALYGILLNPLLREADCSESPAPAPTRQSRVVEVLSNPSFMTVSFATYALCSMLWMLYTWLPDILRDRLHLSLGQAGLVATAYVQTALIVGLMCGALLGDRLMRHAKRARFVFMILGLGICSPYFFLIGRIESLEHVKLAAIGYGFFHGMFTANYLAAIIDIVPEGNRGFAVGFCNMMGAIGGGVSAYLVGLLKGAWTLQRLFGSAAGLGLVAALCLIIALRRFFLRDYGRAHLEISVASART